MFLKIWILLFLCNFELFMMLSGQPPFEGQADKDILRKIQAGAFSFKGPRWRTISPLAMEFVHF